MYSPSLLSMVWHTLQQLSPTEGREEERPRPLQKHDDVVFALHDLLNKVSHERAESSAVPVIWRRSVISASEEVTSPDVRSGRLSAAYVASVSRRYHAELPASEFLADLGAPLISAQNVTSSAAFARCQQRLRNTTVNGAPNRIIVIDRGESSAGATPESFAGQLRHAVTHDIEISGHSLDVLDVLLERLDQHGLLPQCEVHCALVAPPEDHIGLTCFKHANSVELLQAIQSLAPVLASAVPVFANLSIGTHAGPHDGNSPLEQAIHSAFDVAAYRFLHVAVGNHGLRGNAAKCKPAAGSPESLRLVTGSQEGNELLLELWWDTATQSALQVKVEVSHRSQMITPWPLVIDSSQAAAFGKGRKDGAYILNSLFHGQCHGTRSCIALALSVPSPQDLSDLDIQCHLTSDVAVDVNAWIVVCKDDRTAFITGDKAGTVMVPATDPGVISVAGVTQNGQPWPSSSRGPAATYGGTAASSAPYLAHLVDGAAGDGTSFASPRACADMVNHMQQRRSTPWASAREAAQDLVVAHTKRPCKAWNPRTGFGVLI